MTPQASSFSSFGAYKFGAQVVSSQVQVPTQVKKRLSSEIKNTGPQMMALKQVSKIIAR